MNLNPSHKDAKLFIDEYKKDIFIDFKHIEPLLNDINKLNLQHKGFVGQSKLEFIESGNFELISTLKDNNICLNKSRFSCIHQLSIDTNHIFHKTWLSSFYSTTKDRTNKSHEEKLLIDYLNKNLNWLASNTRLQLGSIRTTPYEFIGSIYYEGQHLCQENYRNRLFSGLESPPSSPDKIILLYTSIYDFLLKTLKSNDVEIPFTIDTITTPSEIDARYTSINELNQIRKSYFKHDNDFCLHFINTNILPNKHNKSSASTKMFEQYNTLYKLYINSSFANPKLVHIHNFIIKHQQFIIDTFEKYYETMLIIYDISIERLNAINKPDIVY